MGNSLIESTVEKELARAGVLINGPNPWDIKVNDSRFYSRLVADGSLGLGESYVEGWWDSEAVDELIYKILKSNLTKKYASNLKVVWMWVKATFLNLQSKRRAWIVGEHHYDTGNELFEKMLDSRLTYSCGYWKKASNLDEAQTAKLDLICRKIGLAPGMKVLDIGCGWGSFAIYAAEKYGAEVVGVTISREQLDYAQKLAKGLSVELRLQDYRDINETFDRIVSVGQFEHVGSKNYRHYFDICKKSLVSNGLMLLHTIGSNYAARTGDPWIRKYIFPNGHLPAVKEIGAAIENKFIMEDWHNFGADYDKTLMAWFNNFNSHWSELDHLYDEKFYRMWTYYLKACAGAFRARNIQLWQVVLSPQGVSGGYQAIR